MIRIGSQLTFCSPEKILRRTALEIDERNIITRIFSLDNGNVETAQTLFFDGILSSDIVSVKQHIGHEKSSNRLGDFQYLDFSESLPSYKIEQAGKPLIMDFGIYLPDRVNTLLPRLATILTSFTIFEIIAACTYYPSLLLGRTTELTENSFTRLILWENVDLIEKKLAFNTFIRKIN